MTQDASAHRFLIVRRSSLGDLVHATPIVPVLRASFPEARIDWVVDERWSQLMELVEGVDEVITIGTSLASMVRCVRRLRRGRYTCAVDVQGRYRTAILAWLSGAPRRIGPHWDATREPGAARFYTEQVTPTGKHIAEMTVSLVVHAGARQPAELQFPLRVPQDAGSRRLREELLRQGLREYVVISPGGGWISKLWPAERWGALARELWRREGLRAVVNIAENEEQLGQDVARAAGDAQPQVVSPSLKELAVLVEEARLVVGGDTGPVHLAAALGARVVTLFGDTDPVRNGPLPRGVVVKNFSTPPPTYLRGDYVRGSTHAPAMLSITLEQVLTAVEQELAITA